MADVPDGLETLLVISAAGLPPASARGVKQTYTETDSQQRRDINGTLHNLTPEAFRKFTTEISCDDLESPCMNDVYKGLEVVVDWVVEFSFVTGSGATYRRDPVPDSIYEKNGVTLYRPQMTMLVTDYSIEFDELEQATGWRMNLAEV